MEQNLLRVKNVAYINPKKGYFAFSSLNFFVDQTPSKILLESVIHNLKIHQKSKNQESDFCKNANLNPKIRRIAIPNVDWLVLLELL